MMTHVGFRLEEPFMAELVTRARRHKLSAGGFARHLVIEALSASQGEPAEKVLDALAQIQLELAGLRHDIESLPAGRDNSPAAAASLMKHVQELRADLATVATALLAYAGKVEAEQAKEWVRKNLTR
jgi:hypothetical protein